MRTGYKWPKKASLITFLVVLMASIFAGLIPPASQNVYAENEDKLCVPKHNETGGGDRWETDAFSFEFISRVEIKVTYKQTGNCKSPSTLSSQYLHSSQIEFDQFVNQSLVLEKQEFDGNDYIVYIASASSGQNKDETMIETKNWTDVFSEVSVDGKDWDQYVNRTNASIDKIFSDSEYTIGIEEDLLDGAATCGGDNSNFHLVNKNSDNKAALWDCSGESNDHTGATVTGHIAGKKENFNIVFKATDNGEVLGSLLTDDDEFSFQWCAGENVYRNDKCNGDKYIDGLTPQRVVEIGEGTRLVKVKEDGQPSFDVVIAGTLNDADSGSLVNIGNSSGSTTRVDCETGGDGLFDSAIRWMVCPFIAGAQALVNSVGGWVVDQLEFDVEGYLENDNVEGPNGTRINPVKDAWNAFRIISLSLVIVVALAGILLGSFIDAYTIKKVLPRMLIAIIAISLSWDLMILAINVTNSAGLAVRAIIDAPFSAGPRAVINPLNILAGAGLASGLTTVLGLLSFVGTAAIAVLFAFIFTILRVAAIIAFVIFAPLAILAWVLPNTQKGWNFWQTGLAGALIMFPIVTAFLSIGAAFGKILYWANPNSAVNQVMALIATYAPYFLIPKAFSMAGGVVGNLSGMVNDQGRGAFDRLKKYRQDQGEKRRHDIKAGKFFRGGTEGNWRGMVNRNTQKATVLNKAGLRPGGVTGKKWRANINKAIGDREAEESGEILKSQAGRLLEDDDIATALIRSGGNENQFREILKDRAYARFGGEENKDALDNAVLAARNLNRDFGAGGVRVAALRAKFNSSTGWNNDWEYETEKEADGVTDRRDANGNIVYKTDSKGAKIHALDAQGNKKIQSYNASGKMLEEINMVAGDNRTFSTQLLAEARAGQSRAGREDTGGGGFSDTAVEMDKLHRKDEVTYVDDTGITQTRTYNLEDATEKVTESLINGKNIHELFRSGKPAVARAVAPVMLKKTQKSLQDSQQRADSSIRAIQASSATPEQKNLQIKEVQQRQQQEVVRTIAQEQMMHAVASASSADVAKEMGDKVFSQQFDLKDLPPEIRDQVTAIHEYVPSEQGDPGYIIGAPPQDQPKKRIQTGNHLKNMTRGEVYDRLRNDPTWKAYTKEYGATEAAAGIINPEAAAAAGGDPNATGATGGGGGPTPTAPG